MGCFLACFGSSKDRKRIRHRHKVQPRDNGNAGFKQAQAHVFVAQKNLGIRSSDPVSEIRVKSEKQFSLSPRKKVTFDSNVTTYEHVSVKKSFTLEKEAGETVEKEENSAKQRETQSSSEDSLVTSSSGSYPSNHRYQNCQDSDDELDYGESDDDEEEDEEEEEDGVLEYDDTHEYVGSTCVSICSLTEKEAKLNANARYRSAYVNSVLNPVENLTQWKALKAKGTPRLNQQKENLMFTFKERFEQQPKKSNHEIAVDASLSNWLGSSESTPVSMPSPIDLGIIVSPEKSSISEGSNSLESFNDRPILGALTVEEIKQFSATSSPRRSPSHSPDDMAIIGTVGTHWNTEYNQKVPRGIC